MTVEQCRQLMIAEHEVHIETMAQQIVSMRPDVPLDYARQVSREVVMKALPTATKEFFVNGRMPALAD